MSHKFYRPFVCLLLALAITFAGVSPAVAAPPANDDFNSATVVTEPLPFSDVISTVEATTAADDPDCVGQGPTVWYAFTPSQDMQVQANTFGSDYDTTLSVYTGSQGNLTQIACNDDAFGVQSVVLFDAVANETYFFMVGAFASGPGGNLVFTIKLPPPPLTIDLQLSATGSFDKQGNAILRGTLTCSKFAIVEIAADVTQPVGKRAIHGFSETFFDCNGETNWEITVPGSDGRFAGGRATVNVLVDAFDPETNTVVEAFVSSTVRLKSQR
ncbi:MAG TPA: hypothetical protein VJM08_07285 [Anaerolineales bacterium]|nr:hypothetical protein [Anaerolineales bacterium]